MKRNFCMIVVLAIAFIFAGSGMVMGKDLIKVPTCWMPEHEVFYAW